MYLRVTRVNYDAVGSLDVGYIQVQSELLGVVSYTTAVEQLNATRCRIRIDECIDVSIRGYGGWLHGQHLHILFNANCKGIEIWDET